MTHPQKNEPLNPGYKQTEVGVIPEDWNVHELASISERIMVGIASAATHAYRPRGVPLLRNQNIKQGYLDDADILHVDPTYESTFRNKRLQEGDLLTARTGYPGMTCVVPHRYDAAQSFTTLITRPNPGAIDSFFLCQFINSEEGQRFFTSSQIGGAQQNVNAGALKSMPVPVPPLYEQRAIAAALGDVDALIGALDRLIAKKRDLKQAAMQQLLTGQTRLPGFHGEWAVKKLGDFAEVDPDNLGAGTAPNYTFKYISLEDVDSGVLKGHSEQLFSTAPSRARRKLHQGDVLVSTVRPNLKSHLLFTNEEPHWICSTGFTVVRCTEGVAHAGYVFFHLFGHVISRQIETLLTGSNYPAINGKDVRALEIPLPSLPEQTAIAAVLSDMDAEIAALEGRRDKTRLLKQGMMQELLTGKTRLI